MADLPILFSTSMVQAILREIAQMGTGKTQTRRLTGIKDTSKILDFVKVATDERGRSVFEMKDKFGGFVSIPAGKNFVTPHFIPRIAVGDRLYVREQWAVSQRWDLHSPAKSHNGKPVIPARQMTVMFKAGGSIANQSSGKWEPDWWPIPDLDHWPDWAGKLRQGMHLPKWASRITLIVEDVRIERLNDISEDDAIAEGVERDQHGWKSYGDLIPKGDVWRSATLSYEDLWETINGLDSWDANPWVVAYTFRPILGNIDLIEKVAA